MSKSRRMRWAGHLARMMEKRSANKTVGGSQKKWDHWQDHEVGGWTILKWILERENGIVWIALIWFRVGTSGGLLWTWYWTFGFNKMLISSWVAAQLATSQEGLSSICEWVFQYCISLIICLCCLKSRSYINKVMGAAGISVAITRISNDYKRSICCLREMQTCPAVLREITKSPSQ
jgi:hypothetical protein